MSNEPMDISGSGEGRKPPTRFTLKSVVDTKKKPMAIQPREEQEFRDFVKNIADNRIESEIPKEEKKRLIIPVIETRKQVHDPLKLETPDEVKFTVDANHLVIVGKKLTKEEEHLPLLLMNQNPELRGIVDEGERFKIDVKIRPEEMRPDDLGYERVPVQEFGTAVMLGMGWKPGTAIGRNGTGMVEPYVIEPRIQRLGLGAKKPKADQLPKQKKFIRPGEHRDPKEAERQKKKREGFVAGKLVTIVDGLNEGEYARVLTVDSVENTINVQLQTTYEIVKLEPEQLTIVDEHKLTKNHPALAFMNNKAKMKDEENPDKKRQQSDNSTSDGSNLKKSKHSHDNGRHHSKHKSSKHKRESSSSSSSSEEEDSTPWLIPHIRVRFINEKYKKGKYFNLKGTVVDMTKRRQCICKLDSGELLEDIWQDMLESVVPGAGGQVMIVNGPYKGNLGRVLEKKKETADVQLLSGDYESDIHTLDLDDMAEYVGSDALEI